MELGGVGISRVDKNGGTPIIDEVVLVLGADDGQIFAADDAALCVRLADRLIVEAAHRTVAARKEAQLRRQRIEIVDDHRTGSGTQDQSAAFARGTNPFRLRTNLCERGIRQELLRGEPHAIEQRKASGRKEEIVGALARQEPLREQQVRGLLLMRDLEVAVQVVQAERAREVVPLLGHLRTRQARHARAARIGFFIPIAAGERVHAPLVRHGNAVACTDLLQALRVLDLAAELVTALVHPATIEAEPHARTGVRADVDTRGVDRSLRRDEERLDRYTLVLELFEIGLYRHAREVVCVDESLLQR